MCKSSTNFRKDPAAWTQRFWKISRQNIPAQGGENTNNKLQKF